MTIQLDKSHKKAEKHISRSNCIFAFSVGKSSLEAYVFCFMVTTSATLPENVFSKTYPMLMTAAN